MKVCGDFKGLEVFGEVVIDVEGTQEIGYNKFVTVDDLEVRTFDGEDITDYLTDSAKDEIMDFLASIADGPSYQFDSDD